jgi:hypothetical protein
MELLKFTREGTVTKLIRESPCPYRGQGGPNKAPIHPIGHTAIDSQWCRSHLGW